MAGNSMALRHDPIFHVWRVMVARCTNPRHAKWKWYGGRGIKVCDRWMTFENFKADMGPRPERHTIERKDNNGNYEPGNCVWATMAAQGANKRSAGPNAGPITYLGETHHASEWARRLGLPRATICHRLKRGLPISEVLSTELTPARRGWAANPRPGRRRKSPDSTL